MACIALLIGIVSLAVDYGRVQLVRGELRAAADAAALHAAIGAHDGTAVARAIAAAGENRADGNQIAVTAADVRVGHWNPATYTFVNGGTPLDAAEVTVERTAARGNPVPLVFGALIGRPTFDVRARSIAVGRGLNGGIIGLDSVLLNGNVVTDSYRSTKGPYGGTNVGTEGDVVSNGSVSLTSVTVRGELYMRAGGVLSASSSSHQGRSNMGSSLVVPTPQAGSYATTNDNAAVSPAAVRVGTAFNASSKAVTMPAGTYYFTGFSASSSTVNVTGPVTIYVDGNVDVSSTVFTVADNLPANLTFKVVKASGATVHFNAIGAGGGLYADIQAPTADVQLNSVQPHFYGRLVGKSVHVNSNTHIHVDHALPAIPGVVVPVGAGGTVASLVR